MGCAIIHSYFCSYSHNHRSRVRYFWPSMGLRGWSTYSLAHDLNKDTLANRGLSLLGCTGSSWLYHLCRCAKRHYSDSWYYNYGRSCRYPAVLLLRHGRARTYEISPRRKCILLPLLHSGIRCRACHIDLLHQKPPQYRLAGLLLCTDRYTTLFILMLVLLLPSSKLSYEAWSKC